MPILLLLLLTGVFAYFIYRRKTTTLTRDCRWRQERSQNQWRCTSCDAVKSGATEPRDCLRGRL
ncbi:MULTISPECIES: hypothetical protein [unclassified Pseudophaeobacter]|uniref:hypothetical protein n=1 Tax=unclassified Pseudophaeobacter TaxID=2637024 RepID=UPI000EFB4745|nr:hypothetical protein [Pseudophaeobacter sp. EL27]